MDLIETYLPRYEFRERHGCDVVAPPEVVVAAALAYRPDGDPFFRRMIALRELPMRALGQGQGQKPFGLDNFTLLERDPKRGLVYGLIGQFWKNDFSLVPIADGEAYRSYDMPGVPKLALGFSVAAVGRGTRLTTETRVHCPDAASRLKFTPYWYLIRPVSGLIRRRILSSIKQASEAAIST